MATTRSVDLRLKQYVPTRKGTAAAIFERWALVIALIVLVVICVIGLPAFRTASLFTTMVNAQSLVLLLALTATVVLRTGDFDLSVAQNMVVSAAILAQLSAAGWPPLAAVGVALAGGVVVGIINAVLVVLVGVDSFVAIIST